MTFLRQFLRRELPSRVVDGVGKGKDELRDRDDSIAIVDETGKDGGQGLRRVQRGIVEQHDASGPYLRGDPLIAGVRIVILPVKGVHIGKDLKPLRRKGLRGLRRYPSTEDTALSLSRVTKWENT